MQNKVKCETALFSVSRRAEANLNCPSNLKRKKLHCFFFIL